MNTIRLICRNSRLAVIQAQEVISQLQGQNFQMKFIPTYGDKHKDISLVKNDMPDFFTKELDEALLQKEADIAVHSAKDLPFPLPEGLEVIALTKSLSNADVLVSINKRKLNELELGSKVGTSSSERKKQLSGIRPDIEMIDIRGNIDERIALVNSGKIQGLIVAECALQRLGYEHMIAETLPFETHPLQGHLAVVARKGESRLKSIFYPLDIRKDFGKVTIAPYIKGHPEHLTLKALSELHKADIIYYDQDVDTNFIYNLAPEKIFFSKHPDRINKVQKDIYLASKHGKNIFCLFSSGENYDETSSAVFFYMASRLVYIEKLPGINLHVANSQVVNDITERKNRILVTGSTLKEYEHLGEVIYTPFNEFKAIDDFSIYKDFFSGKVEFDFVVFKNKESLVFLIKALYANGNDLRWLKSSRIIANGNTVANELLKYGLKADIVVNDEAVDSIVDLFIERQFSAKRILIVKAKKSGDAAATLLKRMGYQVFTAELFENVAAEKVNVINLDDIDIVAFATPSAVNQFKCLYNKMPSHISIISDGDDTKRSLYDTGLLHYEPEWVI